jgi:hypothetical protein
MSGWRDEERWEWKGEDREEYQQGGERKKEGRVKNRFFMSKEREEQKGAEQVRKELQGKENEQKRKKIPHFKGYPSVLLVPRHGIVVFYDLWRNLFCFIHINIQ